MNVIAWWGHGYGYGYGGPSRWVGLLVPLLFWASFLTLGIWFLRRRPFQRPAASSAESVLAERFARGEISDDEYRERLSVLKERRP